MRERASARARPAQPSVQPSDQRCPPALCVAPLADAPPPLPPPSVFCSPPTYTIVLIVVSSLLTDAHGAIVRCCRCHGARCASVHVLASLSEGAHASAPSCPLGAGGMALAEYETG